MKLMTVWNAYKGVSRDIRRLMSSISELDEQSRYREANKAEKKVLMRLRQQEKFDRYITGHIDDYDHMMWERRD